MAYLFELLPLPNNWHTMRKVDMANARIPRPNSFDCALPTEWIAEKSGGDPVMLVSRCVVVYHARGHEAPLGGWIIDLVTGDQLA